jgi:transcriptional regulator with XRE-family HTH domain
MAKNGNEPPKYPEIGARLRKFVDESGEPSDRQFARKAGISPGVLSNLLMGYSMPGGETLSALAENFRDFDATFLLTGKRARISDVVSEPAPSSPATPKDTEKQEAAEVPLTASRGGLPTPGEATPQQADFVGRYITRLEKELEASQGREVYWQDRAERLEKPSPTPDATWLPTPAATPISLRPAACTPTNAQAGGKVIALWPATVVARATA